MPKVYHGLNQKAYTLGRKIGQGGEGVVYEAAENNKLAIKIYTETLNKEKSEKLIFMTTLLNSDLHRFATWPIDVITDQTNHVCGFVMQKLVGYVPLHHLFSPMDRKKLFPEKGYNFLIHVARNLAVAFHKIHNSGIIIGDVNEANVLVNSSGIVALIDCDSFQIQNGNKYYLCEVGIPRYTAPELLIKGSFQNVVRTKNTDNFSLTTLIFQLLFLGRAPFTGINPKSVELDEATAIKIKEFAYSLKNSNKKLFPAKNSLNIRGMTNGVIKLFHEAFESEGVRPLASQWVLELEILSNNIISCNKSKIHYFPKGMVNCPWCEFKERSNIIYFLDDSHLMTSPNVHNLEQFINGFKLEKIEINSLNENYTKPNLNPSPINPIYLRYKYLNLTITSILIITTLVISAILSWTILIAGFFTYILYLNFSPFKNKIDKEVVLRFNKHKELKNTFQAVIKEHNESTLIKKIKIAERDFGLLIENYKKLPSEFAFAKKRVEEKHYNISYIDYLKQFDIIDSNIPGFGINKKHLIFTNGIRTAADIDKLHRIKISGIGPVYTQLLFNWQRQIGGQFTYSPNLNAINGDIQIAFMQIKNKREQLETQIKLKYTDFIIIRTETINSLASLKRQYDSIIIQLHQAEIDLEAFRSHLKIKSFIV